MSSSQLATRIISEQTEVQSEKIRRGNINKYEYDKLIDVARKLQDIPLYIDETGGISISQLVARARKLKRQNNLGLLIIDYLQRHPPRSLLRFFLAESPTVSEILY